MKNKLISIFIIGALSAVGKAAVAADEPVTVNIKRMTMDVALRMGQAAIAKCRKEAVQVVVTVVDRGGHEQVVIRDTLAMDAAIPISKKKAYTAMVFNTPTKDLADRFPGAYSVPKLESLIVSPGGIPINIGGNIMGGIGVSGAPSGLTDDQGDFRFDAEGRHTPGNGAGGKGTRIGSAIRRRQRDRGQPALGAERDRRVTGGSA